MFLTADFCKDWDYWLRQLEKRLKNSRLQHSVSVAQTARSLAEKHGCDPHLAATAGLLHDYARDMEAKELLSLAEEWDLIVHPVEKQVPVLLHGPVGSKLIGQDLGIFHKEIVEAVAYHTTGAPGMSDIAGIVYLADIIEPLREFPSVDLLRELAQVDLQAAILAGLEGGVSYCIKTGKMIHPRSVEARNYLLNNKDYIDSKKL